MTTTKKLATAALTGLFTAGLLAAQPALATEHEKGACNGKSGCKGNAKAEKSECKGQAEKASCDGKAKDAHSCNGKSSCTGKDHQ